VEPLKSQVGQCSFHLRTQPGSDARTAADAEEMRDSLPRTSNPKSRANRVASSDAVRGLVGKGAILRLLQWGTGPLQALADNHRMVQAGECLSSHSSKTSTICSLSHFLVSSTVL